MKGNTFARGLAATCNPKTFSVGATLKIIVTVKNNGTIILPVGTYTRINISGFPQQLAWTHTRPFATAVGASYEIECNITGTIPSAWSGLSGSVNVLVYESESKFLTGGAALDIEECTDIITVGEAPTVSAEIVSITVS